MLSNSRLLCEMEQTLRRRVDAPHAEYDETTVEEHKLEIQEILGVINPQSLPSGGNLSAIEDHLAPDTSATKSGTP